jgi:hypothetical protein
VLSHQQQFHGAVTGKLSFLPSWMGRNVLFMRRCSLLKPPKPLPHFFFVLLLVMLKKSEADEELTSTRADFASCTEKHKFFLQKQQPNRVNALSSAALFARESSKPTAKSPELVIPLCGEHMSDVAFPSH